MECKETGNASNRRLTYLDIAKGIGILLVVWAHANGPFKGYIYQMHMPFFFLISGFLFNDRISFSAFLKRRFRSLYIPFVFWNMLSHTVKSLLHGIGLKRVLFYDFKIMLTLEKDGQFFGATWFLAALFLVEVIYKMFDILLSKNPHRESILLGLFLVAAAVGFIHTFSYMFSRTLILSLFYAAGVWVKRKRKLLSRFDSSFTAWAACLIFLVIGYFGHADMGKNNYGSPVLFVIGAFAASYTLIRFCRFIDSSKNSVQCHVNHVLNYFGVHSKDILIWQFVCFRIVIIIQMLLNHEHISAKSILSYYPVYSSKGGWWAAYFLVGTIVPVLICNCFRALSDHIFISLIKPETDK